MSDPPAKHTPWRDARTVRIDADLERVWSAWAEPEHVRRWFSDDASGTLEVGGELVHIFEGHGEHRYTVVEVEAPHRLVLEGRMLDGEAFRQEVTIRRESGVTVLELVHSGFGPIDPDDETVRGIDSGWSMALTVMKHYVERYFDRDKVSVAVFRPAAFDYDDLARRFYRDAPGRTLWLDGRLPSLGDEMLRTEHEVCLQWPDVEGVLELKAFGSSPRDRVLGVRAVSWSEEKALSALSARLERSVENLLKQLAD